MQRYHIEPVGWEDEHPDHYVDLDDPCDRICEREHVYVLTDAEYKAVNRYIRELDVDHIGTPSDDDDYIADAIDDFHRTT